MTEPFGRLRRFLRELKRRKVYRVAAGYLVAAFVALQLADLGADAFGFPGWFEPMIWVVAGLGFPLAIALAWAFEVAPEGVRRTPESEPGAEDVAAGGGLRSGYRVLVGLGLVAAAVAGGWYLTGGGGEGPEASHGTVAVLPFQVSGSGADAWRDGMVTMLTTGLDGAMELRAIPDRTVLAAWEEASPSESEASSSQAISVARQVGARYAIVGSAVALGDELRLTANVRSTQSGDRLGRAMVRGVPDSVPSLADSLTRRVLGILAEEGADLPSVDLSSLTTSSLPALKSYLAGERHLRAGEYEAAITDYRAAVEQDSTFALAHVRLAETGVWVGNFTLDRRHWPRAYELSDRLPLRERRIIWSQYVMWFLGREMAAVDSLRRWTEVYPDDPRIWWSLGAGLAGNAIPGGWPESDRAVGRAIELDPDVPRYHHDHVIFAFSLHHDSALAARRIDAHPEGRVKDWYQTIWDLKFGDAKRREAAWGRLDTMPLPSIPVVQTRWLLLHPSDVVLQDRVWRRLLERPDIPDEPPYQRLDNWVRGGRIDRLTSVVPGSRRHRSVGCNLAEGVTLGLPVPDSVLRSQLTPSKIEQRPSEETVDRLRCAGLHLAERGPEEKLEHVLDRLERLRSEAENRPRIESRANMAVRSLEGYRASTAGDLQRAAELWSGYNAAGLEGAIWRGDLHRELGELERAEEWYTAAWSEPVAHERLGRLYEETGEPEKAAAAYRRFIAGWTNADEMLQPRVKAARERLEALTSGEVRVDE